MGQLTSKRELTKEKSLKVIPKRKNQPSPPAPTQDLKETIKTSLENRWARLDARARKFAMIFGSAVSFALALLYGPTIFYLLIFVIGGGAYTLYPDKIDNWIDNHQWMLGFAAFGTLFTGPLGFIAGAWLGNFLEPSNNRFTATAASIYQHTPNLNSVTNAPSSAWQSLKNTCQSKWEWTKSKFSRQATDPQGNELNTSSNSKNPNRTKRLPRKTQSNPALTNPIQQRSLWNRFTSLFSRQNANGSAVIQTTISHSNNASAPLRRTRAQAHAEAAQSGTTLPGTKPPPKNPLRKKVAQIGTPGTKPPPKNPLRKAITAKPQAASVANATHDLADTRPLSTHAAAISPQTNATRQLHRRPNRLNLSTVNLRTDSQVLTAATNADGHETNRQTLNKTSNNGYFGGLLVRFWSTPPAIRFPQPGANINETNVHVTDAQRLNPSQQRSTL